MLLRLVPSSWLRYVGHAIAKEQQRRSWLRDEANTRAKLAALEEIDEDANIFDDASLAALAIQKRAANAPPPGQFGFGADFSEPTPPPEVMSREELLAQTDALRNNDARESEVGDDVPDEEAIYCLQCRHRPCVCTFSENPF